MSGLNRQFLPRFKFIMLKQEEQLVDGKGLTKINTMVSISDAPMLHK